MSTDAKSRTATKVSRSVLYWTVPCHVLFKVLLTSLQLLLHSQHKLKLSFCIFLQDRVLCRQVLAIRVQVNTAVFFAFWLFGIFVLFFLFIAFKTSKPLAWGLGWVSMHDDSWTDVARTAQEKVIFNIKCLWAEVAHRQEGCKEWVITGISFIQSISVKQRLIFQCKVPKHIKFPCSPSGEGSS